jgi:hypothetical protein
MIWGSASPLSLCASCWAFANTTSLPGGAEALHLPRLYARSPALGIQQQQQLPLAPLLLLQLPLLLALRPGLLQLGLVLLPQAPCCSGLLRLHLLAQLPQVVGAALAAGKPGQQGRVSAATAQPRTIPAHDTAASGHSAV